MIHRSTLNDVALPATSIHDLILAKADEYGDRPAAIDGPTGRTITFAELAAHARALANGLIRRGLARGQSVGVVLPNLIEYSEIYLGISRAGGVVASLNPLLTESETATLLTEGRARFVITAAPLLEKVTAAATAAGVEEVFVVGPPAGGATELATLYDEDPVTPPPIDPASDLVSLPFSSGTSGRSKGVMLSHRNIVAQVALIDELVKFPVNSSVVVVLPYFHIYGLTVIMLLSLWKGNTQVVLQRFELESFLQCLERYRVRWVPVVPPIVLALAKHPVVDRFDLTSIDLLTSGAAPLGEEIESAASARLGCRVSQGYGMTELSGASHLIPLSLAGTRPGSCGLLIPNHELRIVDPQSGESLGTNARGEIWIRGPVVMQGYLGQPEATRSTLVEGGWLRTGDIGYCDDQGFYYVVDRLKELIKYKAFQVAPAPLEALLVSHADITDAAVIPSPDAEAGEVPKAFVVRRGPISADEVMRFVADRVATYEQIRKVEFVDSIPKSPSGKILRRILVEQERQTLAQS